MRTYSYFICTDFGGVGTVIKGDFEISSFPGFRAYPIYSSEPWQLLTGTTTFRVNRPLEEVVRDLVDNYGCSSDVPVDGVDYIYRLKYMKNM